MTTSVTRKTALMLVILLGVVSLFADITYEGARSISGQYLAVLGASGTVVGIVAGLGEFIGYGFRLAFGYLSDRTGRYWLLTIIGYAINLLAVPLLALAGNWPLAAALMIMERFGKAVRSPAKDALLSYAAKAVGRGWGFGLHEAMDQIGAITGPLIVSCVLYYQGSYQTGFAVLLIPAVCALAVLACASRLYRRPQDLEVETHPLKAAGFSRQYWLYLAAICCVAAGYVDFPLIAFHFEKSAVIPMVWVPVFFSIAMAADGISALICGRYYDRHGIVVLMGATALAAFFAPLVFMDGFYYALTGMVLWGIGMGAQESIMRAFVADLVAKDRRGTAYGMMNIWFGIFWFFGSALMGFLYDVSLTSLIIFSISMQLASLPLFFAVKRL